MGSIPISKCSPAFVIMFHAHRQISLSPHHSNRRSSPSLQLHFITVAADHINRISLPSATCSQTFYHLFLRFPYSSLLQSNNTPPYFTTLITALNPTHINNVRQRSHKRQSRRWLDGPRARTFPNTISPSTTNTPQLAYLVSLIEHSDTKFNFKVLMRLSPPSPSAPYALALNPTPASPNSLQPLSSPPPTHIRILNTH